jgi:hypothetical protein
MHSWVRRVSTLASLFALVVATASTAAAQGVASSSITGSVTQEGGRAVEGANVTVINSLTGQRFQLTTRSTGRYTFENLPPGGPYTVEVRAIGFQAGRRTGINLTLGQRLSADFALVSQVVEVQELVVQGEQDAIINRGRTGAASTVGDSAVQNLPSPNRSFTDLITTSPAVSAGPGGRPSIAGTNNRYNNIQIDGAVNNDLFGLGSTGAPGGQTQGRAIPLEAVKEFQVLVAPFDVRQGGFVGGLINAVTRSGDNTFQGSVFTYGTSDGLVSETPTPAASEFSMVQFGGSVSGPIVRDRAHFLVSYDQQVFTRPYSGVMIGQDFDVANGAARCAQVAARISALGYDAGSCGGFNFDVPNINLFAKITSQAGPSGQIEFTANYASSDELTMVRESNREYWFTGGGYKIENTNFSPRLKWTNVFGGRFNNEMIVGYSRIRDPRTPERDFTPVFVNTGSYTLVAGAEVNSHQTRTFQDVWEFTNNTTFDVGTHRIMVGTHNEFFQFLNDFYSRFRGQWTFASPDSFDNGLPLSFERNVPAAVAGIPGGRGDGPSAEWSVRQFGLYAQDMFSPLPNLTLTLGIRADVPFLPATPPTNPRLLAAMDGLPIEYDTGEFPSGNFHWSPRLGFNYDLGGRGDLIVRGGAGVFTGRPPYVWLSNAYSNSGLEQARLFCSGVGVVPTFTGLDPDDQPTSCAGSGGPSQAAPDINMFDPAFKFPQSLRFNVGIDKRLPFGMVASIDGMYSNTFNSFHIIDYNLAANQATWPDTGLGAITGEGGRLRYGNVAVAGNPVPLRHTSQFRTVLYHFNRGLDYSYSGIFQLQKRFSNSFEATLGYTYSRAFDQMTAGSSTASSNFGRAPLDGPMTDRNLRPAAFDRPHKLSLSGMVHLPYNLSLAMQYVGISGAPYAYLVQGDANGDGVGSASNPGSAQNDLFYVPIDQADFSFTSTMSAPTQTAKWDSLNAYIERDPCLREQRGEIIDRNSCRNPWQTFLNATLSWSMNTTRGQRIEISAAFFNVLHFLNEDWGIVKETSQFEGQNIVRRTGWDVTNDRNTYDLTLPTYQLVNREASRGRVLLGAKYTF